MRPKTLMTALTTALALAGLARIDGARAGETTTKEADRATIGGAGLPDLQPADPRAPKLERARGASAPRAAVPAPAAKPRAIVTSAPAASAPSAAQREKLAALAAAHPAPAMLPSGKPADLTISSPPAPGARPLTAAELAARKAAPRGEAPDAHAAPQASRASRTTAALGVIPRPEWALGRTSPKPKDESTAASRPAGPGDAAAPGAGELQRRAARTAAPATAKKPAEVTTSAPRDPAVPVRADKSAPAASASKSAREVKP